MSIHYSSIHKLQNTIDRIKKTFACHAEPISQQVHIFTEPHLISYMCSIGEQKEVCGVVMGCYDSIALYLCAHLIHQYRLLCHKRAVPALDNHWEQLLHMIWPR